MSKVIKLIILTNQQILVSEIEETGGEIGEPDCKLIHPVILKTTEEKITVEEGKVLLSPWLQAFTDDTTFMMSSDKILTLAEPGDNILEKYKALIKRK